MKQNRKPRNIYAYIATWSLTRVPRLYNGKKILFDKWCWENGISIWKRIKLDSCYTTHKNRLKMDYRLKYKTWNNETSRGTHKENLHNISIGNNFLDLSTKGKLDVWVHETKNILHSKKKKKKRIIRVKRQPIEWEKLFVNHLADKGLISKILKTF